MNKSKTFISDLDHKEYPISERVAGSAINGAIVAVIQAAYPEFKPNMQLSVNELNAFRKNYLSQLMSKQIGELSRLEENVLTAMTDRSTLSEKPGGDDVSDLTLGQRLADKVATFGGSWSFILTFLFFMAVWIAANVYLLGEKPFDPYPFILLNLILSCIASLQAPIIMMSQNRQEEKDRERAKKDYMINLKSELEIRLLHEKIDHLIIHQQQELLEIQQLQIDMMNDILESVRKKDK
ncbi:MAG TPA: DUF1003 domain-containing protein [Saprospiraceae bacterium]|nr:DUF1003 domain-containing protein [Saprospiraceae bacterium]HRG21595.1 DUF1003 domain-containing protein [Saprospiraceae bacterium]